MPVNKMAIQNVWQDHFLLPRALLKVGKTVAQIWSHVVGIAATQEFCKNGRFRTAPCITYMMAHYPRSFYLKYHRMNEFNKKT
jgi:hypothetical protein